MIDSFVKYIQHEKRVSSNTVLAYQKDLLQLENFIQQKFPEHSLAHADYGILRTWIVELVESGLESSSVNRKIATLRSFYKYLLREEIITKDPLLKIRVLKTKKKLPAFVKETEMEAMLDRPATAFDDDFEGSRNRLILELFYATGIRLSELIMLEEKNVDLANRTIKVLGKRNKERVIPFPQNIISLIQHYRKQRAHSVEHKTHGYLFVTQNGNRCYPVMIYRIIKKYLDENTNADKRSPHVLRHTFATHLLNKGAEINAVKDLLGHSSLAATQVYTHNSIEKLKKTFDQAHPKA